MTEGRSSVGPFYSVKKILTVQGAVAQRGLLSVCFKMIEFSLLDHFGKPFEFGIFLAL